MHWMLPRLQRIRGAPAEMRCVIRLHLVGATSNSCECRREVYAGVRVTSCVTR
jgi:hypothetical protein